MKLEKLLLYICTKYNKEISKARLAKTLYLADWKSSIERSRQISNINWVFDHYGPYSKEVVNTARNSELLNVTAYNNNGGELISASVEAPVELSDGDRRIIDHVIKETKDFSYDEFLKKVYSTYPILSQDRYTKLNLPALAKDYNKLKSTLG